MGASWTAEKETTKKARPNLSKEQKTGSGSNNRKIDHAPMTHIHTARAIEQNCRSQTALVILWEVRRREATAIRNRK